MGFRITDKEIDKKLDDMVTKIKREFGIRN